MVAIGPFQIEECVGSGGMGVVHRASWGDAEAAIPVAVKFITRASRRERDPAFVREARMAARLSHPNVVTLLDVGTVEQPSTLSDRELEPGVPYLVMEWVDGPTVQHAEPETWAELADVLDGLLAALAHAHAWGVVHRDIKPGNVMLTSDGDVKLTDFGIGRVLDDSEAHGKVLGTPQYMAPEQIVGSWRDEGPWTDLYGVGILAWRLATGSAPFTGVRKVVLAQQIREEPHEFHPRFDVPPSFEQWIRRALEKRPHDRFRRAADAREALKAVADIPVERRQTRRYLQALNHATASVTTVQPPMPERWTFDDRALSRDLRPAGLGLFGLRTAPIVGRDAEKATLWGALRRVVDAGEPSTVIIRGNAGMGKSALAEWLQRRAVEGGFADVLQSFWESEPVPGDGIEGTLERYFAVEEMEFADALDRVQTRLRELGFDDDPHGVAVSLTERITRSERTTRNLASRDEWFHVLGKIIGAIAARRPIVWLLDDVQWSSEAVEFVRDMTRRDAPVLFVQTLLESTDAQRPPGFDGHLEEVVERDTTRVIDLGPLDDEAQRELVGNLLRLEPGLVEEVVHRTDGSPLFAAQLLGDWVMRDALAPSPFGYRAASEDLSGLPDDIHEMWQRRLDVALRTAPPGDRRAVQVAAVLGNEIDLREWKNATEHAACRPTRGLIETLVVHGLATWNVRGFAFIHRMLRESILLASDDRQELDLAVAESLLAVGFRDGRTRERAARHLSRAGHHQAAFSHLVEAIEQYYQAEDIDSVILLGGLLEEWSARADADESLTLAAALCRVGAVYRFRGELDAAKELLNRAVALTLDGLTPEDLIDHPHPARNKLFARATSEIAIVGEETIPNYEITLHYAKLVRDVAGAADIALEEAWGAALQASTLSETGRPRDALDAARFAVARLERADLTQTRHGLHSYYTLSEVAKLAGELDESREAVEKGLEVARAIEQRIGIAYGLSRRAGHHFTAGELDAARESAAMAYDLYRRLGSPTADYIAANVLLYDIEECRFEGTLERARQLLDKWLAYGLERRLPTLHVTVAVCEAQRGTDDQARMHFEEALACCEHSGRVVDDAIILSVLLARHTGDADLRREALEHASSHVGLLPQRYVELLDELR